MDKNLDTIQTIEINNELKYFATLDGAEKIKRTYASFSNYRVASAKMSTAKKSIDIERAKYNMDKSFIIAEKEFQALTKDEKFAFMDFVLEKIQACKTTRQDVVRLTGVLLIGTIINRLETVKDAELLAKLEDLKIEYKKMENKYLGIDDEERDFGTN